MKQCSQCKQEKELNSFYKSKKTKSGLYAHCKKCHIQQCSGLYSRKLRKNITPYNLAAKSFDKIRDRVKYHPHYKNIKVEMSVEELTTYIENNWVEIKKVCDEWEKSGFSRKKCPSVDRLDPCGNYSVDNIQIISVSDNISRAHKGVSRPKTEEHKKMISEAIIRYRIQNGLPVSRQTMTLQHHEEA